MSFREDGYNIKFYSEKCFEGAKLSYLLLGSNTQGPVSKTSISRVFQTCLPATTSSVDVVVLYDHDS